MAPKFTYDHSLIAGLFVESVTYGESDFLLNITHGF